MNTRQIKKLDKEVEDYATKVFKFCVATIEEERAREVKSELTIEDAEIGANVYSKFLSFLINEGLRKVLVKKLDEEELNRYLTARTIGEKSLVLVYAWIKGLPYPYPKYIRYLSEFSRINDFVMYSIYKEENKLK